MRLRVVAGVALAVALAAPLSVAVGDPAPAAPLESCAAIDLAFWQDDARLIVAQLGARCDAVVPLPAGWTERSRDHWSKFRCAVVRRAGAECGEAWSAAFTCRCERDGRERAFGKVVNCSVQDGRLACETDCTKKGCAQGAILEALAPADLPDLQACLEIPRPPDPWTDVASVDASFSGCVARGIRERPTAAGCALLERTLDADPRHADRCYASLAAREREPRWCDQIIHPRRADGCLATLAETLPDPALCERLGASAPERRWDLGTGPRAEEERRQYRLQDLEDRRRICRTRAVGGPPPKPQGAAPAQRLVREEGPVAETAEPQRIATRDPASGGSRARALVTAPTSPRGPGPVFLVGDTFVDDEALGSGGSPLSCHPQLVERLADHFRALEQQARERGRGLASDVRSIPAEEVRALRSALTGCEFDARLTYWGLLVEGGAAAWREVEASPTLELAVVPATCEPDLLLHEVRLRFPQEPLLIVGLPAGRRPGKALYQALGPPEGPSPTAPGTLRTVLATPRIGGIREAVVVKRVVSWTAEESESKPELVVERATLVLERDDGGKPVRVEVFRDEGYGKYLYAHADVGGVHLLDADLDGDVDVLLSAGSGARYLILLERGRPQGAPVQLRRPRNLPGC